MKNHRLSRLLFAFLCIFYSTIPNIVFAEKRWEDLAIDHPYIEAIEYLKNENIIQGYEDDTFRPDGFITRAEALKIILLSTHALLAKDVSVDALDFTDVEDLWYVPYIQYAVAYRIVIGYEDNTFRPDKPVTRAEFVKMVLRAKNIRPTDVNEKHFNDIDDAHWAFQYVGYLFEKQGLPDDLGNMFYPDNSMTRALAVEIMYRFIFNEKEIVIDDNNEKDTQDTHAELDNELQSILVERNLDTGVASYYHDSFHGQNTASGEVLDNTTLTAAHPYMPMGSVLRVTNINNDKSVEVIVNDCGPFSKNHTRVIDLTQSAFEKIGSLSAGLLEVHVEVLSIPQDAPFRQYCYDITNTN